MIDPRTSTALPHLALPDPPEGRWDWATARIGPAGRIRLPDAARTALGALDGRGRLYVPRWLRSHPALVVGARPADQVVVVAPTGMLDTCSVTPPSPTSAAWLATP